MNFNVEQGRTREREKGETGSEAIFKEDFAYYLRCVNIIYIQYYVKKATKL